MSLKEIGKTRARAGSSGVSVLLRQYSKDIVEIHRQIYASPGLKADLKIPAHQDFYDLIRFSAFVYDHTSISLIWGAERVMNIPKGLVDGFSVS
ncbi:MAG: hypothetical protein MN733_42270, partial [Nitrososphaera sp.]|nr:hypothetical protein [Nitrososphaera sp.]